MVGDKDGVVPIWNFKEKVVRIQNILLASLFVSLYGCQPEAPAPKAAAPAAVEPSAATPPPPAQVAAQPTANEVVASAPVQKVEPASPEKITATVKDIAPPSVAEKSAVAEKPVPAQEVVAQVSEADALQLAKKNNCLACHAVDKKVVGPSFKDVAAKYRGDAGAEARLADKIAKGGGGAWGPMAMPPSPQVSEADRKILAKFVLSLK